MAADLPAEVWLQIFHYASEDDALFDYALPTSMVESSWFKMVFGGWTLRSANEGLNVMQRRSYATKKAIMATCRTWRQLGQEFMFRFLFINDPTNLVRLRPLLDRYRTLGWWAKRLHITRYYPGLGATIDDLERSLVAIIRRCPNLEIFVLDWPIKDSLLAVADSLCTYYPTTLRTLHLNVPSSSLAKVILMLDALPALTSLRLTFDVPTPDSFHLGAAANLTLTLNSLEQLSLCGPFQDFFEQLMGWELPALRSLSLDFLSYREDLPDIIEFLTTHGSALTFLDINCIPVLDVPTILDLCPLLQTIAFNFDWRLDSAEGEPWGVGSLVNRPHAHITTIGCHWLHHAFGVGDAAKYAAVDPLVTHIIRRRNDMNFAAINKQSFPKLQRVRVLDRMLLRDLEAADGPSPDCFERWERWWNQCASQGVRLEDCTGALLGTLPQDEPEDDESEEEEEVREDLRDLIRQCRAMTTARDEPFYGNPGSRRRSGAFGQQHT
ncbi:hypothetical protein DAEQUDRAFT_701424 [Daedalea quercina L-15889]|uniref:F-box domain-containing protein n=1 Tax=Daedalea quercina L-15889 TaxID=1314783 RepID=A0A165UNK6_9APHY|nr:hypothetical protein DAEQUDRAFT_701424 [Daedalea quercina L-15889]